MPAAVARHGPEQAPGAIPRPVPAEPPKETIWVRLATAADRILENPAFDPSDAELVVRAIGHVLACCDRAAEVDLRRTTLARRDRLIREAAARFYAGRTRARAMTLLRDARCYAATAWLRDRGSISCPLRIQGTVQEALWHAFRSHPTFPSSLRQMQNILAAGDLRNTYHVQLHT